jgi:hypothetical protein
MTMEEVTDQYELVLPVHKSSKSSVKRVHLSSLDALEVLKFQFGASKKIPCLFAHQSFNDEKLKFPSSLCPLEITVSLNPSDLSLIDILFDHETPSDTDEETLSMAEKCKKVIHKKILTSHYGDEKNPIKYPKDTGNGDFLTELNEFPFSSLSETIDLYRIRPAMLKSDSSILTVWRRFEWLMLFFVDATSSIEANDPSWELMFVINRTETRNLGLALSLYRFPVFPIKVVGEEEFWKYRIAQFITVPSLWGTGIGELVFEHIFREVWESKNIKQLTLEDGSDGMLCLRDVVLLKKYQSLKEEDLGFESLKCRKIAIARIKYILHIKDCAVCQKTASDGEASDMECDIARTWKNSVKWLPDTVSNMEEGEEKETAKEEFLAEEWEAFLENAKRVLKRVNRN